MSEGRFWCHCGTRWNAVTEVHCAGCHCHFAGYEAFDMHLRQRGEIVSHLDPGAARGTKTLERLFEPSPTPTGTSWSRRRA